MTTKSVVKEEWSRVELNSICSLNELEIGYIGNIVQIAVQGKSRKRLFDLGLTTGTKVQAIQKSPSGDLTAYMIRGALIAIRNEDARNIFVRPI